MVYTVNAVVAQAPLPPQPEVVGVAPSPVIIGWMGNGFGMWELGCGYGDDGSCRPIRMRFGSERVGSEDLTACLGSEVPGAEGWGRSRARDPTRA